MLIGKIYALGWALMLAAAATVYVTGWFNFTALVVFGFMTATLIFLGVIAVLPSLVHHHYSPKGSEEKFRTNRRFTAPEQYIYR